MKESRNKYLIKNTVIFAIGNFGTKFINFFMVPLYTYALSTAEYGEINAIVSICSIIIPLIMCNIGESVRRYMLDKGSNLYEIECIEILWMLIGCIISAISYFILLLVPVYKIYALEMSLYIFFTAVSTTVLDFLRGKECLKAYTACSMLQTLLTAGLNILFLVKISCGIRGYFWSYIIAAAVCSIAGFVLGKQFYYLKKLSFNSKLFKDMSMFSLTLVPNSIMWWINNASDKLMITYFVSSSANGLYSVAAKLSMLMSTISGILMQAWQYSAIKENESKDKIEYNNKMYKLYVSMSCVVAAGLLLINKPFMHLYVAEEFKSAWCYSPFLILSSLFSTIATFVGTSYYVVKDMKGNLYSAGFGAFVNVSLNAFLIPTCGVLGACIATCISHFVVYAFRIRDTFKYLPLKIDGLYLLQLLGTLVVMTVFASIDSNVSFVVLIVGFSFVLYLAKEYFITIVKSLIFKKK